MSSNSFAYCLFHAITFERKVFSKIHESKSKKSLKGTRVYRCLRISTNAEAARAGTDTHTDRQTDTQDDYSNPLAHARRGLIIQHCILYVYIYMYIQYVSKSTGTAKGTSFPVPYVCIHVHTYMHVEGDSYFRKCVVLGVVELFAMHLLRTPSDSCTHSTPPSRTTHASSSAVWDTDLGQSFPADFPILVRQFGYEGGLDLATDIHLVQCAHYIGIDHYTYLILAAFFQQNISTKFHYLQYVM